MATSRDIPVPVPMSLKGDLRGNWNFFKAQFDNYEVATGLDKKDEAIRIATLLTIMGKDCFQVYQNLNLTADDRKKLENILKALTEHFEPKTNVIYERYVFNTTDQLSSESVDDYVCRLRELSRSCKYNEMADPVEEMIRDRLVLGTKDNSVRARMLGESNLNLTNTIDG